MGLLDPPAISRSQGDVRYGRGQSTVIFVDPAGSDSNPGLIESAPKQTIAAALAALPAAGGIVELATGAVFTLGASDSFVLDAAKHTIRSGKAILNWTAAPTAGYAFKITSTGTYGSRYNQWRRVLDGVAIRGQLVAPNLAAVGIIIGEAGANLEMSNFVLANGGVEGFATCMRYASNSWRVHAEDFHLRNGSTLSIDVPVGLTNYGECMTFDRCMIEGELAIGSGEHHFFGCSFDNAPITCSGDGKAYATSCHFENPTPSSLKRFGSVTGASAGLYLSQCEILINGLNNGSNWTFCLFYVDSTATSRGLLLSNIAIPQTGKYHPEDGTDAIRSLVAGTGRVVARGIAMNNNSNPYPIAPGLNGLQNGNAETGTTIGWTATGTTAAFTNDDQLFFSGTRSFKLAPTAGNAVTVSQRAACRPGEWAMLAMRVNVTRGTTGTVNHKLGFYNADGALIQESAFTNESAATSGWALRNKGAVAPPGTAFVALTFYVQSGASELAVLQFDEALLTCT